MWVDLSAIFDTEYRRYVDIEYQISVVCRLIYRGWVGDVSAMCWFVYRGFAQRRFVEQYTEYGEIKHNLMKENYEHMFDEKRIG